jgi:sortase A
VRVRGKGAARGEAQTPAYGGPRPSPAHPSDDRMTLTIPTLARVDGVSVATAPGTEEGPLRDGAMHLEGAGFPWQDGANVYIAGHRLGFHDTGSDRLFWDLEEL